MLHIYPISNHEIAETVGNDGTNANDQESGNPGNGDGGNSNEVSAERPSDAFADDPPQIDVSTSSGDQTASSSLSTKPSMTKEQFNAEHFRLKLLEQEASIEAKKQLTRTQKAQEELDKVYIVNFKHTKNKLHEMCQMAN